MLQFLCKSYVMLEKKNPNETDRPYRSDCIGRFGSLKARPCPGSRPVPYHGPRHRPSLTHRRFFVTPRSPLTHEMSLLFIMHTTLKFLNQSHKMHCQPASYHLDSLAPAITCSKWRTRSRRDKLPRSSRATQQPPQKIVCMRAVAQLASTCGAYFPAQSKSMLITITHM